MFIYADESGHSGRFIFNEPQWYYQGAILSTVDTEPILQPLAEKYRKELKVDRLHANELRPQIIEAIASSFLLLLEDFQWVFHLTVVEKPYLAVTKFVDSIFDSEENKGVRWLWYNHEFFRHTLCCLFDDVLTEQAKKEFWDAYLEDDYKLISSVVKFALETLNEFPLDKRLYTICRDGLLFALKYPEEITLLASETKKSYRGHTPNMVAFSSLIHEVHRFCKEHKVIPEAFVHDPQSEFGTTMREYHELFGRARLFQNKNGFLDSERVDYDLGKFSLTPSRYLSSLQAVDLFLWLNQRNNISSPGLKKSISMHTDPFYISRASSELIRTAWAYKLDQLPLSRGQIKRGKVIIKRMEKIYLAKLREFKRGKLKGHE